jgi:apolipoprotein D and lipocalin family protein
MQEKTLRTVLKITLLAGAMILSTGFGFLEDEPVGNSSVPQPIKVVELERYLGRWYELGGYPAIFQEGCSATFADYSQYQDGSRNAKLKVSFFGPFYGDYWVLDHASDYSWSIVGEPSGRYLWLLSRTPHPPKVILKQIEARAAEMGYNLKLLKWTEQP